VSQQGDEKRDTLSTHLVISRTEDKVGIGVVVENTLDNLSLVDSDRPDFKILLSNQDYQQWSASSKFSEGKPRHLLSGA
jgi:hypothetical protein